MWGRIAASSRLPRLSSVGRCARLLMVGCKKRGPDVCPAAVVARGLRADCVAELVDAASAVAAALLVRGVADTLPAIAAAEDAGVGADTAGAAAAAPAVFWPRAGGAACVSRGTASPCASLLSLRMGVLVRVKRFVALPDLICVGLDAPAWADGGAAAAVELVVVVKLVRSREGAAVVADFECGASCVCGRLEFRSVGLSLDALMRREVEGEDIALYQLQLFNTQKQRSKPKNGTKERRRKATMIKECTQGRLAACVVCASCSSYSPFGSTREKKKLKMNYAKMG